ncbi:hypothetical protein SAMN05421739_102245 [Pontibacter chinhatensis]|uniref:Uncharacterized protein n=1 Tax=Pontibacter chinhatensis TaxID=1436961 RepID=A0A1I2R3C3_9BACT|nr:hypothetical protein SAMN05421739_102245 [Pontibacter chinhatensis]
MLLRTSKSPELILHLLAALYFGTSWRELVEHVFSYLPAYTFIAAASRNLNQAILTSYRSSSSSHKRLVASLALELSSPRGLAFGHRAAFASCPHASGCRSSPEPLEALSPKAGNHSIALAIAVISTFGRELKRIPDRSLALLEMTEKV